MSMGCSVFLHDQLLIVNHIISWNVCMYSLPETERERRRGEARRDSGGIHLNVMNTDRLVFFAFTTCVYAPLYHFFF